MIEQTTTTGTATERWNAYWASIASEELLAAKALLELSPTVRNDVVDWLREVSEPVYNTAGDEIGEHDVPDMNWTAWADDVETTGRPFSTTEANLARIVAALTAGRPINLIRVLGYTGSWETDVWRILVDWGTGGNTRDVPGRATVISTAARGSK